MRRSVFLCAAAAVVSMVTAKAQDVETIYFDKDGQEVKVKEFAEYYRIIESGDTYPKAFLDYYMDGTKFRTGGKVVSTDAAGTMVVEGDMKEYNKDGSLHVACQYVAGKPDGLYVEFRENGGRYERMYDRGVPTEKWGYLYDNNGNMSRVDDNGNPYHLPLTEQDRTNILAGGQLWQDYFDGSISVAAQLHPVREYGKYYRLDIFIGNSSLETFEFNPANTKMVQKAQDGGKVQVRRVPANEFKNKIDKRMRTKSFWFTVAQAVSANTAGDSYSTTATNMGFVSQTYQHSNAGALYGMQVAEQRVENYKSVLASEMSVLSDNYLVNGDVAPGTYASGFILFEKQTDDDAEVTISFGGQDYLFSFKDLGDNEYGSWEPVKDAGEAGFALALSPMVARYLNDGGSKSELAEYESSIIDNLNASQSDISFSNKDGRYTIIMEIVSADEDDAELRGWAYLYDNSTDERVAAAKIKAEGGRGSTFNLRLEKSLQKAVKSMLNIFK